MKSTKKVKVILEQIEQYCKNNDCLLTTKRKLVLSSLLHSSKALSAYNIIDLCKELFDEEIAPMSMYRILEFLENANLVHKLQLVNKYVIYSHISCNEKHNATQFLICKVCDQVKEVEVNKSAMMELKENVALAGFQLAGSQLEINCICHNCR